MTCHSRRFIALSVALLAAWALSPRSAWAVTLNMSEFQTADAAGNAPGQSNFAGADLLVRERRDLQPPEARIQAFMKFDLSALGGQFVQSATLNLHEFNKLNNANSAPLFIAQVQDAWAKGTNDPVFNQAIVPGTDFGFGDNGAASAGPAVDITHTIDVTNYVNAWQANPAINQGVRLRIGQDFVGAAFDDSGPLAPVIEAQPVTGNVALVKSNVGLGQFQTAARNGESPATTAGDFNGVPVELFVRGRADSNNPELEARAFLKFDLSGVGAGDVINATLMLHEFDKLNNVNSADMFVAQVGADWDATSNKPTFDQAIVAGSESLFGDNGPASAGRAVDIPFAINVTDFVQDWLNDPSSNFGLRLRIDDAFVGAAFDATGPLAPQLMITQLQAVPEPATGLLGVIGLTLLGVRRRRRQSA